MQTLEASVWLCFRDPLLPSEKLLIKPSKNTPVPTFLVLVFESLGMFFLATVSSTGLASWFTCELRILLMFGKVLAFKGNYCLCS